MNKTAIHSAATKALPWIGLLLLWGVVFVPHLLHSGFISDDWSVVKSGVSIPGFWDLYRSWFPLFSNRPAAPLILSFFSRWAGDDPTRYIAANLVMWLTSLGIVAAVLRRFFSSRFPLAFLALASFPSISSTVIFSVAMQLVAVASLLCWAISFALLDRYLRKKGMACLLASNLLVLASLLIYEITLPLLVINLLYPALFHAWQQRKALRRYCLSFVIPPTLVLAAVFLLQKVVMPCFMPVYSRLSPGSLGNCLGTLLWWLWALLVDFPVLLLDALQRIVMWNANEVNLALPVAAVVALAAVMLAKGEGEGAPSPDRGPAKERLLAVGVLALLSASFLFVLSGSGAQVGGYANRGMTSTWILLALVIAIACDMRRGPLTRLLLLALVVLNAASFMLQSENYAQSWKLQKEVARSLATELRKADPALKSARVLAHVPPCVPWSYNDEVLFQNSWDLGGAVWHAERTLDLDAMPLHPLNVALLTVKGEGASLNYWKSGFSNLWFYEYNARLGSARLVRVADAAQAKELAAKVAASDFNVWPPSLPLRLREAFNGRMSLAVVVFAFPFAGLLRLFGRSGPGGGLRPRPQEPCRVCGGVFFRTVKEADLAADAVSPLDFRVTDSGYGATCALACCSGCGFLQGEGGDVLRQYQVMEDPAYEEGRAARALQFQAVLQELAAHVPEGALLDVGAGSGILVEQALARGYRAQGIEPSGWMVAQAAARELPVLEGILPDPRLEGPYRAVTLLDVIEHVSDPAALLGEIHRLLEEGGYLILTTPDVTSLAARLMGRRWWHYRLAHISYFSPHTVALLLQRCGFEVVASKRTGWYFELSYLMERLMRYVPGAPSIRLPAALSNIIVPLNLFDSLLLICRKKP